MASISCYESFIGILCILVFYLYLAGGDMLQAAIKGPSTDECDIKKDYILRTCSPNWFTCYEQLKYMRCRSNPVKARLASGEYFHPYIRALMENGKEEFHDAFGKTSNIAVLSFAHSLFLEDGGAVEFVKLVGGIEDTKEAEEIAYKMPLRGKEVAKSKLCSNYTMIKDVPEKYGIWKTEITDKICTH